MRIKYGGYKLRGYYKMADLALKYLNMTKPAKTKLDILTFFNKHGLSATKDAYSISRSSLYRWKQLYRNYGINGLEEKRTCPHNTRKRHWDYRIVAEIERIRAAHPRLGARKIIRRMRRLCLSYDIERVLRVFPLQVSNVLSDNGSEFMKHFREMVDEKKITHWKIYPKRPQMNAICERFNRTIQEEFVNYNTQDLINPKVFNHKLSDWLYWYNCERDHHSLGYNTPMEFMEKDFESQVIWGHTKH